MHTKLQLKALLLHQNLIYNLYGNTLPAVISFMFLLSNYYNISSELYFNVPLFNYKVIFKYSYFIIPSILLCTLCHSPVHLTGSVIWRFPLISKSGGVFLKSTSNYLFFPPSSLRQKWMVWLLQPCNQASLSLLCFFAGTNVKSSADTSQETETLWVVQCSAPTPTATYIFSPYKFLPTRVSFHLLSLFLCCLFIYFHLPF